MGYSKQFNPTSVQSFRTDFAHSLQERTDKRDGEVYVFGSDENIVLAVNVALATGRPLLIYGPAGSGKSSIAPSIARNLGWRYYEGVITSRTQAQDLLWTFDVVQRLGDATSNRAASPAPGALGTVDLHRYVQPGVLWWAFDAETATRRGLPSSAPELTIPDPSPYAVDAPAVVLLDEIDKADPDVPNNLLVPIGSLSFTVKETGTQIGAAKIPLIIFTSNEERDLPSAFVRRCVILRLPHPTEPQLNQIAEAHFGTDDGKKKVYESLARKTIELQSEYVQQGQRPPSTAEFLDAVRAALQLKILPDSEPWKLLIRAALSKPGTSEVNR
ncbi:MoxR family ATPase [Bradyrhizobium sp. th.b2]|uniref:AAA family ATPase n=1 Tax=Bradyrhizobium sp. th-b2 TaxID=172088 RepID=UPI000425F544|nr:MoxR family ATPase [Bradyrhizobium sp. th.b2]